ncbi:MAG: DMT family transporter [Candidimonas sp.]|nr:MAG: DMT family transporter [Candidimonas sp.]
MVTLAAISRGRLRGHAGIGCMLLGVLALSVSDALVKFLDGRYAALQILFLRAGVALPVVTALALALGGRRSLRTPQPALHAWRGLLNVGGAWTFYLGLSHLPLAATTSIAYVAPVFVVLLSALLLHEPLAPRRLIAVAMGFAGVTIIARPGGAAFQTASLLPLCTAVTYALMMISARRMNPRHSFPALMFYTVLPQAALAALALPWTWQAVAPADWPVMLGISLFSTLGISLVSQSFRLAPAAAVAPFDYTGLLWATFWGWLIWDQHPDGISYLGMALIIAAGLSGMGRARAPR